MKAASIKFKTVDEYISTFPAGTKKILQQVRTTIKAAAPQAEDVISYNMPASKLNGILVYYAAYEKHIGFYPTASGIKVFEDQLGDYKFSKGAIQFPIDKPMPVDLITKIVKFRVKETWEKEKAKKIIHN
jgi:uncharacterized protein YdhG (YjbR/CyaY superfamily)